MKRFEFEPPRFFEPEFKQVRYVLVDKNEELLKEGKLSENFRLSEFTRSTTARRLGIDNTPNEEQLRNLDALVDNVLQPARERLGMPLHVTSGLRVEALNRAVGGSRTSDHMYGRAADVETRPETPENMWKLGHFIETECAFRQLIWEFGGEWIHVAYDCAPGGNRGQVLEAYKNSAGRTRYRPFTFVEVGG
jgi:hypothetical protein